MFNFLSIEDVSRYSNPQLQGSKKNTGYLNLNNQILFLEGQRYRSKTAIDVITTLILTARG